MEQTKLRFSEFVDLLLVRLYDLESEHGDRFFDLNAVAQQIRDDFPPHWVFDAAKVLENRGWANCLFTFGGVEAQISGEGRLYVDEGRGLTGRAKSDEAQYFNVVVTGDNNQIVTGSPESVVSKDMSVEKLREPAFAVLREMRHVIDGSSQLSSSQKIEANTYVNLIELHLKKPDPDRRVIAAVLDPLGKISALASHVANLIKFFNG